MLAAHPFFVWFPCRSYAEWNAHVAQLERMLCRLVPTFQRLLYPRWANEPADANSVVFHLGAAVIVVEHPNRLGWYVLDTDEEHWVFVGSKHLHPMPDQPGGLVWVLEDDTQELLVCPPGEENNRIPLRDSFPEGLAAFLGHLLPGATRLHIHVGPDEFLGEPIASWRIPYREPDVAANLSFVVEMAPSSVHGLVVTGEITPGTSVTLRGSMYHWTSFDWEQRVFAPAPVLEARVLGFVWCDHNWTLTPPQWEAGSVALLAQPLGDTTRLTAFGDVVAGPLVAAALDPVLARELDAERRWSAPVLLPVLSGGGEPLTGQASHAVAYRSVPAYWPHWTQTLVELYPRYLAGELTIEGVARVIREKHPEFMGDGGYLLKWRHSQARKDPTLVEQLLPMKYPDRATAIRRARRQYR
ncbi:hypothetical protein HRbin27_00156 [bacterium HR27]|nr:hypothetical protein HRbin27_00156 [bacterium HR27]